MPDRPTELKVVEIASPLFGVMSLGFGIAAGLVVGEKLRMMWRPSMREDLRHRHRDCAPPKEITRTIDQIEIKSK